MNRLRRRARAPLRAALLIEAPPDRVRVAVTSLRTWTRTAAACGWHLDPGGLAEGIGASRSACPPLGRSAPPAARVTGGQVLRLHRGRRDLAQLRVVDGDGHHLVRLVGVGASAGWCVSVTACGTRAGSLVTIDVRTGTRRWPGRARVLRGAQLLLGIVLLESTALDSAGPESTGPGPAGSASGERSSGDHPNVERE